MNKTIEFILEDRFFFGVIFIIVAILLLILRIYFKESPKMKNHSAASWKGYINSWVFIAIIFIIGLSLLLD